MSAKSVTQSLQPVLGEKPVKYAISWQYQPLTSASAMVGFTGSAGTYTHCVFFKYKSKTFGRRNQLCCRAITSYGRLDNRLPKDVQCIVLQHLENINAFIRVLSPGVVFNMDETPGYFDMPRKRCLAPKGSAGVELVTSGYEKSRYTVVLGCVQNGAMLKPMIIFKGKEDVPFFNSVKLYSL